MLILLVDMHWEIVFSYQCPFSFKALGRFDVLEVNSTEDREDFLNNFDHHWRIVNIDANGNHISSSQFLKQSGFAFHHWQSSQWSDISVPEHCCSVSNDHRVVFLASDIPSDLRVLPNFLGNDLNLGF